MASDNSGGMTNLFEDSVSSETLSAAPHGSGDVEAAAAELENILRQFAFDDEHGTRIEFDMPVPHPIARHLAERGVRVHADLAVIKPGRGDRGEQTWVPLDTPDPEPETGDIGDEQIEQMETLIATMQSQVSAARAKQEEDES